MYKQLPRAAFMNGIYAVLNGFSLVAMLFIVGITTENTYITGLSLITVTAAYLAMSVAADRLEMRRGTVALIGSLVLATWVSAGLALAIALFELFI